MTAMKAMTLFTARRGHTVAGSAIATNDKAKGATNAKRKERPGMNCNATPYFFRLGLLGALVGSLWCSPLAGKVLIRKARWPDGPVRTVPVYLTPEE